MIKLDEYIGGLVSSITNARMMSDIQAVKVAEEYAKHNLLKHFPVPRMRLDGIEMTIPVALDEVKENQLMSLMSIDKIKFYDIVNEQLVEMFGWKITNDEVFQRFISEIELRIQKLEDEIRKNQDLTSLKSFSKDIIEISLSLDAKILGAKIEKRNNIKIEELISNLEQKLLTGVMITNGGGGKGYLNVIVEAHKLREQKPETLIYIKLKISEEGMEWNWTENEKGDIISKLLPE